MLASNPVLTLNQIKTDLGIPRDSTPRHHALARVSLPEDLWAQGPKAVNAEIKRLEEAERAKVSSATVQGEMHGALPPLQSDIQATAGKKPPFAEKHR